MNNVFGPLFPPDNNLGPTGPTGPQGPPGVVPGFYAGKATGLTGGSGSVGVTLPAAYPDTGYVVMATMEDTSPAEMSVNINTSSTFTIYWQSAGSGPHAVGWFTIY